MDRPFSGPAVGDDEESDPSDWFPTAEELDQLREAARAEGHEEGLASGRAEAASELEKERQRLEKALADKRARLDALLNALAEPLADADQQVLDQLAELAMTAARHVVGRELQTTPGEVMAVIREALALLPAASPDIRVHVSPEDYNLLAEAEPDHAAAPETAWRLVRDTTISTGGCRVLSGHSVIDATVQKRLNQLFFQTLGVERRRDLASHDGAEADAGTERRSPGDEE